MQRAAGTLRRAADFEVERRFKECLLRAQSLVFKCWRLEVRIKHSSMGMVARALRDVLWEWRVNAREWRQLQRKVAKIQALYRAKVERRAVAALRALMDDQDGRARVLCMRIMNRFTVELLSAWRALARQFARAKELSNRILAKGIDDRFRRWVYFVFLRHQEKHWAASKIAALARGKWGRERARVVWLHNGMARRLQVWLRGRVAKIQVQRMKEELAKLNGKILLMLTGSDKALQRNVFRAWHHKCVIEKKAKSMVRRIYKKLMRKILRAMRIYVGLMQQERMILHDKQTAAVTKIQKVYRGLLGRRRFDYIWRLNEAALLVQATWRGQLGYRIMRGIRWQHYCATAIQAAFRGFQARRKLVGMRIADVLRAAEANHYDKLLYYFENFGDGIGNEADETGNNALHRASQGAARRTVKLCLARGIDPNLYNGKGMTPLHLAMATSKADRDQVAAYLMDHGSYIEAPDYDGNTPLLLAARLGRAAIAGHLLDRKADIHVRDFDGSTALQVATIHEHVGTVQSLLDHGAPPDEAGADGITPLHEGVGRVNPGIVGALLEAGAIPDAQDDDGYTPLMYASSSDEVAMATVLLEWGASVDCRDAEGRTALHIAAEKSSLDVIQTLLDGDSDLMAADVDGDTALHVSVRAAARRDEEAIEAEAEGKRLIADNTFAQQQALKAEAESRQLARKVVKEAEEKRALKEGRGRGARRRTASDDESTVSGGEGALALVAANQEGDGYAGGLAVVPYTAKDREEDKQLVEQALAEAKAKSRDLVLAIKGSREAALELRETADEYEGYALEAKTHAENSRAWADRAIACVEKLLCYGALVTAQNEDGDQAAHLAARLGHVRTMELLVQYEAPMGRRNWSELTPVGVARMQGQRKVVAYLLESLAPEALGIFEDVPEKGIDYDEPVPWDLPIQLQTDDWEEAWDEENQTPYYLNRKTGEMSLTAPMTTAETIMRLRDFREERGFKAQVQVETGESLIGTAEYRDEHAQVQAEIEHMRAERRSAVVVQKYWRRLEARRYVQARRERRDAARRIQRMVRWKLNYVREKVAAERLWGAQMIQRCYRGYEGRNFYYQFVYERQWWARHTRFFAALVQRLWSGHKFRKTVRRMKAMREAGHLRYEGWQAMIRDAKDAAEMGKGPKAPLRSFNIYDEYHLAGSQDTLFYVHQVTFAGTWEQPAAWRKEDFRAQREREEVFKLGYTIEARDAAVKLQGAWRSRSVQVAFKDVMRGQRLMKGGELAYMQEPDSPVALSNFALFTHVMKHDYEHARHLYSRCVNLMAHRGPDNAFVLYSYAIFLAVTQEDDWETIDEYVERAHKVNKKAMRRGAYDERPTRYNLAKVGYYRLKTATDERNGEGWHNYAMCLQLAFKEYDAAQDAYIQAILRAPHDERILANFNHFLTTCRPELIQKGYDAYELVRVNEMGRAEERTRVYAERLAALDNPEVNAAARRIQMHFRASKLRGMMGAAGAVVANVHQATEEHTMEERTALVRQGVAQWLWERVETDDPDRPYYYNNETGDSIWDEPEDEFAIMLQATQDFGIMGNLGDIEEWELCDDGTGRAFYFNANTGESQWEKPAALMAAEAAANSGDPVLKALMDMKKQDREAAEEVHAADSLMGSNSPNRSQELQLVEYDASNSSNSGLLFEDAGSLGSVWEECEADDGKQFWFNTETQESTWVDPRTMIGGGGGGGRSGGGEWEAALDVNGKTVYTNQRTGESTYERPDGYAALQQPPSPTHSTQDEASNGGGGSEPIGTIIGPWELVDDEDGNLFWYNNHTGASQWERPEV